MLITAPYQNNIITRAHPTIILVTRDRLLLSASLSRYSGKLLRFCEKKRFESIYIYSSSPFLFMEIQISPGLMKKRFDILENCCDEVFVHSYVRFSPPLLPLFFSLPNFTPEKGESIKAFVIFLVKIRNRIVRVFRSFRFILLVSSRKFENFGKFRTRFHINSFRPRKKKKKTSRKVFA